MYSSYQTSEDCYEEQSSYRVGQIEPQKFENSQSRPQSEFVALPLLWDTLGRSAI